MNICDNREIINKGMFDVIVVGGCFGGKGAARLVR